MSDIKQTEEYSIFKGLKGNRDLIKRHVDLLTEVLKKDPKAFEYSPIVVNENLELIDGQHRLAASMGLGLPVYFIVHKGLGIKNTQELNYNTRHWLPRDYAKSYADNGNVNYQTYLDTLNAYPFLHGTVMKVLSGYGKEVSHRDFRQGNFEVRNLKKAVDFFDKMMELGLSNPKVLKNQQLLRALWRIYSTTNYNHNKLVRKTSKHKELLSKKNDVPGYLRELEAIYNMNGREGFRVRFF